MSFHQGVLSREYIARSMIYQSQAWPLYASMNRRIEIWDSKGSTSTCGSRSQASTTIAVHANFIYLCAHGT